MEHNCQRRGKKRRVETDEQNSVKLPFCVYCLFQPEVSSKSVEIKYMGMIFKEGKSP
jgi:hypothetical protein